VYRGVNKIFISREIVYIEVLTVNGIMAHGDLISLRYLLVYLPIRTVFSIVLRLE